MNLTDRIIHFSVKFNFITRLCIFSVFNEICFSCFNFQNKIIQLIKNENNFQIFTRCRKFRIATKLRISLLPAYIYIYFRYCRRITLLLLILLSREAFYPPYWIPTKLHEEDKSEAKGGSKSIL